MLCETSMSMFCFSMRISWPTDCNTNLDAQNINHDFHEQVSMYAWFLLFVIMNLETPKWVTGRRYYSNKTKTSMHDWRLLQRHKSDR